MTLGRAGVAGNEPDTLDRRTDVAVNADGDVFVTDGHGQNNQVVKFDRNGPLVLTWGRPGDGPAEFDQPHTITLDSRGRVFVGDRSNGRVQIFEPGRHVRPGVAAVRATQRHVHRRGRRALRHRLDLELAEQPRLRLRHLHRSAVDGTVHAYIPDPDLDRQDELRISGASGITADREGNVSAADVGPQRIRKYVRR